MPEPEKLLQFRFPEKKEVEVYLVRRPGKVPEFVARTAEELEEEKKKEETEK